MKRPPLVEVTWVDACLHSRTFKHDELEQASLATRNTAGYLVRQDPIPGNTYLAQTLDKDDQGAWEYDGVFTIPTGWVTQVRKREPKPRKKKEGEGEQRSSSAGDENQHRG